MTALQQFKIENLKFKIFGRGFTLLELLIAITIIAIISTAGFITYSQSQVLARDARRKADLRAIAIALELYRQQNGGYPVSGVAGCTGGGWACWWKSDGTQDPWITGLDSNYINLLPKDPKSNDSNPTVTGQYGYVYWGNCGGAGKGYFLGANLENKADPDRHGVKNYKWCGTDSINTWGWAPTYFAVSSD